MAVQERCATAEHGVPATLRSLLAWSALIDESGSESMRLASAEGGQRSVLIVVDGLGWDQWQLMPTSLKERFIGAAIPTVSASTTTAALTSCTTGVVPGVHGIVAGDMLVAGRRLNSIRWTVGGRGTPPDPLKVQSVAPFRGVQVPVVSPQLYEGSGLTKAHLRGGRYLGWESPYGLVERARASLEQGASVVYCYYPYLDRTCHGFGVDSPQAAAERDQVAALLERSLDQFPPRTAVYVTADHGMVDIPPAGWLRCDDLARSILHWTGEGRMRMLHVVPGSARGMLAELERRFGATAWIWSRDDYVDGGWLGTSSPSAEAVARLGDIILGAHLGYAFESPDSPYEPRMVAHHGSVTPEEMLVPWVAGLT